MTTPSTQTLLEFALDAVWQAGRITLGYFQSAATVERKADNSPVTLADREAEQKLRGLINQYWPDHGIIGEEFGRSTTDSRYTWVIDPIDGTHSFICGVPFYSMLLALADGDDVIIGIIHLPALNETVYAVRGGGCYWNGRRAHVSRVDKLDDAIVLASELHTFAQCGREDAWHRLIDATYQQRTWGDGYGHSLVATGRAEVMVDPILDFWDAAPLQVILEEAGGTLTDWQGNSTVHNGEAIATNGVLFEQVMDIVGES